MFTSKTPTRDNGSGTWIVTAATPDRKGPVREGDTIRLQNAYPGGGFLDVNGRVTQNPMFKEYEGSSLLVFTSDSPSRHSNSGSWTVTTSKVAAKK